MLSKNDLDIVYGNTLSNEFVFIVCARNCEKYIDKCLDSVFSQTYTNWGMVIFDDASTDGTYEVIEEKIKFHQHNTIMIVKNKNRFAKMRNFFYGTRFCCTDPNSVIIDLDGDDWLSNEYVLERIKKEYDNGAEQTVGSCEYYPKHPIPKDINLKDPRSLKSNNANWLHPRTFKKGLFDLIGIETFTNENSWFNRATDWTYVPFLIEMSRKTTIIHDILYIYNIEGNNHFLPENVEKRKILEHLKIKDFIVERVPLFPKLEKLKENYYNDEDKGK